MRRALPDAVEGEWEPERRLVNVEFATLDAACSWYASLDYAETLDVRAQALRRRLLLADGLPPL